MSAASLFEVGDGCLCTEECASCVHSVHEVKAFGRGRLGIRQVNGSGVIDDSVNSTEVLCGLCHRALNGLGISNIQHERKGPPTRCLHFCGNRVNRPREGRMGFGRF